MLIVLGMQGFILALVGEYLGRIHREVEGRPLYTIEQRALASSAARPVRGGRNSRRRERGQRRMQDSARDVLAATLAEARDGLPAHADRTRALIDELAANDPAPGVPLADTLVALAGADAERRTALADLIGLAARRLAPDDEPPAGGPAADAWQALVAAADGLYGSGVAALGRLPFLGDRLLELLAAEARMQLAAGEERGRRAAGAAGRVLATLAVRRKLRDAVAAGLGLDVVPAYSAVYLAARLARPHACRRERLRGRLPPILEHDLPGDGSGGSALVVHRPAAGGPERLSLRPGEGVALRGRGTIHSWELVRDGERRTLIAIEAARRVARFDTHAAFGQGRCEASRGGGAMATVAAGGVRTNRSDAPGPLLLFGLGVAGFALGATAIALGVATTSARSRSRCSTGSASRTSWPGSSPGLAVPTAASAR